MIAHTKDISDGAQNKEDESVKVPLELRKSKVDQVMAMLEREYVYFPTHAPPSFGFNRQALT